VVGALAVDAPAPQQGGDDEYSAVGGVDAAKVVAFLQGWDDAVGDQDDRAQNADDDRGSFPEPASDQVTAADLGQSGGDEQRDSTSDCHAADHA
jgi:hypothetical protein